MRSLARLLLVVCWAVAALGAAVQPVTAQDGRPLVLVMTYDGPVAQTMVKYVERGIQSAEQQNADLLVLQLNTPGGYLSSMNVIIQLLLESDVPVVVYVSPQGAMAASAGTLITLAAHAGAMAPSTIIGAASPVGGSGEDLGETMAAKEKEAMRATVRSLMTRRSPEAIALAEDTIENARAVSEREAYAAGLVDFIAADLDDLLQQMDGHTVYVHNLERQLHTANANVRPLPLSFVEELLNVLANPNIIFLLITIGIQAVLIEISSPGGWAAGFIGVVCLALATYGMGILPVNWFGLLFIITAFVLFVLDIKAPTHGALTVAGAGSLILGALVLFDLPDLPGIPQISVPLVIAVSLATAIFFGLMVSFAIRAQKAPVRTGQEGLIGRTGITRTALAPRGQVQVAGELWTAELDSPTDSAEPGEKVEVMKVEGITLRVRKA